MYPIVKLPDDLPISFGVSKHRRTDFVTLLDNLNYDLSIGGRTGPQNRSPRIDNWTDDVDEKRALHCLYICFKLTLLADSGRQAWVFVRCCWLSRSKGYGPFTKIRCQRPSVSSVSAICWCVDLIMLFWGLMVAAVSINEKRYGPNINTVFRIRAKPLQPTLIFPRKQNIKWCVVFVLNGV